MNEFQGQDLMDSKSAVAFSSDMLLDSRTLSRPYLQRQTIQAMVQAHVRGERNCTLAIHKILTLELVHRLFVDL